MHSLRNVVIVLAAAFTLLAAQPRTLVLEFEPVMVDTGIPRVVYSLLRDRLAETKAFTVVLPPAGTKVYTIEEADSLAAVLGAEKVVMGSITRVGLKLLISYKLVTAATGAIEAGDRVSVENETDLDNVTGRIALALKEGSGYKGTVELGRLTEAESKTLKTREPYSSILFNTGYTFPTGHAMPYDPGKMLFTLDAAVTYEAPSFLAEGQMGIMRGKYGFTDLHFELLAHRLFSGKDISPFVGGGLGVHRLKFSPPYPASARESDGLSLVGSGGLLLFRTYYFRALIGAKASVLFTNEFGTVTTGNINFGLTSPGFGPSGTIQTPPACIYTTLGAFFVTGLIVALTS
jgi:hypothetical protein